MFLIAKERCNHVRRVNISYCMYVKRYLMSPDWLIGCASWRQAHTYKQKKRVSHTKISLTQGGERKIATKGQGILTKKTDPH